VERPIKVIPIASTTYIVINNHLVYLTLSKKNPKNTWSKLEVADERERKDVKVLISM
jgi:hypothetical protein